MNKQRIAIFVIAALGISGTFMPWLTVPFMGTIYGTRGDGWITLVLYSVPLLLALIGTKSNPVGNLKLYTSIIISLLASGIGIWKIVDINEQIGATNFLTNNPFAKTLNVNLTTSIEYGLYVVALSGILLTILSIALNSKINKVSKENTTIS